MGQNYCKILEISNTRLVGVNKWRFTKSKALTPEYREFKRLVYLHARKHDIKPPFVILMQVFTGKDIDGVIKPILDAVQYKIGNDKLIGRLLIDKIHQDSRLLEKVVLYAGTKSAKTFYNIIEAGDL